MIPKFHPLTLTILFAGAHALFSSVHTESRFEDITFESPDTAKFRQLVASDAQFEVLADGFTWSEGPTWVKEGNFLLFSDVPENTMYRWSETEGISIFLQPSGYTGIAKDHYKQGSNGLAIDHNGDLIICEGGDRRLSRFDFKEGKRRVIADNYNGARFNSPNDLIIAKNGNIYFTDPVWGLEKHAKDPFREMTYQGIFLLRPTGEVELLTDQHQFPNGIVLSPDESTLYECQFGKWYAYPVQENGLLGEGVLFYDATTYTEAGHKGSTDGMAVDIEGNLWATGPAGIHILAPDGNLIGIIHTIENTGNCCFGGKDGSILYLTSDSKLCRIQTKTKGLGF